MHFTLPFIGIPFFILVCSALDCDIIPDNIIKPKNKNDINRYILSIQGNPKTYTPNQKYNVSLKVNPSKSPQKSFRQFYLTLAAVEGSTTESYRPLGQFEFETGAQMLMQFSDLCPNTVVENSKIPKWDIQVYWIAPPENSGCIAIKATVVESRESWFSEDGQLTKILCEDTDISEDVKPPPIDKCCACSEAKYEVAFEGRWTRNTHPRHFPSDIWSTKFSDIIGASHRKYHSFWNELDYASDGLKELAETGRTHTVESEIKEMGTNIRTIIKARGLQHPNITESSYAVFRVDSSNHLVSVASKIIPSPDWFVGVANFELCQKDCTWIESYTLNLYPMDAGTNDGIGYMSSEPILFSRKPVMPITPNNPNDPMSPFFSEDGDPMNPIAKIHFTRQRLYDKPCDSNEQELSDNDDDCKTTDWSDWTPCPVPCGLGKKTRMRSFVNKIKATNCYVPLVQQQTCKGTAKYCTSRNKGRKRLHEKKSDSSETKKSRKKNSKHKKDSEEMETNSREQSQEKSDIEKEEGSEEPKDSKEEKQSEEEKSSKEKENNSNSENDGKGSEENNQEETNSKEENKSNEENESREKDKSNENEESKEETESKEEENSNEDAGTKGEEKSNEETESKEEEKSTEGAESKEEEEETSKENTNSKDEKESDERNGSEAKGSAEEQVSNEKTDSEEVEDSSERDENSEEDKPDCRVTEWSEWSSCSAECGYGTKTRDRKLINPKNEDKCDVELQDNRRCKSENGKCTDDTRTKCSNNNWGPWSSCSKTCGQGIKRRLRLPPENPKDDDDKSGSEESNCSNSETVNCYTPCNDKGLSLIIEQAPDGRVINCRTTNWSIWGKCQIHGGTCGKGTRKRYRQITRHPVNGGKACPRKLIQSKRCTIPCTTSTEVTQKPEVEEEEKKPECIMSDWTPFTPCSSVCGSNARQLKTRKILYKPPGAVCPPRVFYKQCNLPLICSNNGKPIF